MTKGQFRMLRRRIAGVDAVEASTRHSFPRHTHDHFGIGLIYQGAQRSLSGRGLVEAERGDVITVNPGEVHDGTPIGDAGRSWRMLYLDPAIVETAVSDISEGGRRMCEFADPVIRNAALAAHFHELFVIATTSEGGDAPLRWDEFVLTLVAEVMQLVPRDACKVPESITAARSLIDDDPLAAITLADLARESRLSRFQLVRRFAKATGLTPHAYLVQRRIDIVRRLIAEGTSLAEAAIAGGFADQSHMTRVFVRTYGVSPGAYVAALG
ncbi:AraC family transcriptional regulator [Sinorhizobium chiapasense]|uniref:AraC family transcriptional regulator n=1 Tax=Sinorhizobium chiapasense TaxID=501572 RepID=A0ABZ2BEH6_9HYPH